MTLCLTGIIWVLDVIVRASQTSTGFESGSFAVFLLGEKYPGFLKETPGKSVFPYNKFNALIVIPHPPLSDKPT